jgi:AraC family transcriptional regulator
LGGPPSGRRRFPLPETNRKIGRASRGRKRQIAVATEDDPLKAALKTYQARMLRVLDYIDQHLESNLNLDTLSSVAAFSKYHFHRQFTATFGLSVHRYVQLARIKRASHRLASDDAQSITDIAMDAGYDAPDAFARAFRRRLDQSPSSFRQSPDWPQWLAAFGPLENARSKIMRITFDQDDVMIRDVPPTAVAIMEHRGDRAKLPETIRRFRAWRSAAALSPETSSTFMVFRSERCPEDAADYSIDLCAETDRPVEPNDENVRAGVIPGGRCAVLRYPVNTNNLEPASLYLYRDWLPASGEEVRDFPHYSQRRLSFIPEVSAHEVVVEILLPLK